MPGTREIDAYRMTHIDNIPHILENGITHPSCTSANPEYVPIGDTSLIASRNARQLGSGKTLGNYIPFYFSKRTPMLFVIQHGHNSVPIVAPENIVYCVCSLDAIVSLGSDFLFSDGHAYNKLSSFYDSSHLSEIETILDWEAIHDIYWKDEQDTDKKRRKEAECLIGADIPLTFIKQFVVYNDDAKEKLLIFGVEEEMIEVNAGYYF